MFGSIFSTVRAVTFDGGNQSQVAVPAAAARMRATQTARIQQRRSAFMRLSAVGDSVNKAGRAAPGAIRRGIGLGGPGTPGAGGIVLSVDQPTSVSADGRCERLWGRRRTGGRGVGSPR